MLPCFWDHVTAVIVNQRYFVFKKIQRWIKFDFPQYLGSCTFSRQLLDWILYSPMADTIRHPSYKPPAKEDMYLPPRTIENREIKSHIYGKQQTSHISWEFLRTENKHINRPEQFLWIKLAWQIINRTGCPRSSFPYFISLYFSTIGLGKQII